MRHVLAILLTMTMIMSCVSIDGAQADHLGLSEGAQFNQNDWLEGTTIGVPKMGPFTVYGFYANTWNEGGGTAQTLTSGDQVTIAGGPFRGLDGIFQRYTSSGQRCRILLQVVGRLTSVQLDERDLALALPRL